nr:MAG TPA: hypothetical protein [Caudoviricetes sp.]
MSRLVFNRDKKVVFAVFAITTRGAPDRQTPAFFSPFSPTLKGVGFFIAVFFEKRQRNGNIIRSKNESHSYIPNLPIIRMCFILYITLS